MVPIISFSSDTGDIINLGIAYPVQVVWDAKALVANKSTAIRLFVQSTFTSRVWVDINVTYNFGMNWYLEKGPYGNGTPIDPGYNRIYIPGGPAFPAFYVGWRTDPMALRWNKTGIDDNIEVTVDPLNVVQEVDETNNFCTFEAVEIVKAKPLKILFVPVGEEAEPRSWAITSSMAFIKHTYPVAFDSILWMLADPMEGESRLDEDFYEDVVRDLSVEARILGYDRVVVLYRWGMIGGRAIGMLRQPEDRVPIAVSALCLQREDCFSRSLVAHEIGHTYYLWHPHDIGPPVYDATMYSVLTRNYEYLACTFMSYSYRLPEGVPSDIVWIDKGRYDSDLKTWINLDDIGTWQWNLFDQLTGPEIRLPIIVIFGWIFLNGTVILGSNWYRVPEGIPDILSGQVAPQKGNYSILMLDSGKQVLSQTSFNVSFTYLADLNGTLTKMETDTVPFVFSLPYFNGTTTIQIRNATDHVVAERAVTPNPPIVEVIFPNGRESLKTGHNYTITWDAYDSDGDKLTYLVAYSRDNGQNWIPLANNVNETQYVWDTSNLVQGEEYLIKVMATDGVNTGEDVSNNTFEVLDVTPPVISNVTQNPPSNLVQPDQTVNVKVNVTDINSGVNNVTLMYKYSTNNGTTWSAWKNVSMENETEITFSGNISGFPAGTLVQYKIFAIDNANNTVFNDNAGKYYIYTVIPEFPQKIMLLTFLMLLTIPLIFAKKKHYRKTNV